MKVVIIGGVAGGASAAARLRRLNEQAEIIILERGNHVSFANCGIPYYAGGVIDERDKLLVATPEKLKGLLNLDVRVRSEALKIDREKKTVLILDKDNNKEYEESYDKLILSPGAKPFKPPIEGIEDERILTIRNLDDADKIKDLVKNRSAKSVAVIGGGYIGLEMAENLFHLGLETSVIELSNQIMPVVDFEIAAQLQNHLRDTGVKLYLENGVKSFKGGDKLSISLNNGEELNVDFAIMAIGVKPENELAVEAGLEVGSTGGIKVNNRLQTTDHEIYALGDAIEVTDFTSQTPALIPLAGPANRQGRIVADNISGIDSTYEATLGTSILKLFDMTVGTTGNSERLLKRNNIPYLKAYVHGASHAEYYPEACPFAIKLLFSPDDGKILGSQVIGIDGIDKRIDVIATAMKFGKTVIDLKDLELSYAPPYGSAKDPVNIAGMVAENILTDQFKVTYWDEFREIRKDSFVIDVRTPEELAIGKIDGSVNIPLQELRSRLDEIPKDKRIITYCSKGLKSYFAARILLQNGFENVFSLSGGYLLYKQILWNEDHKGNDKMQVQKENIENIETANCVTVDACGIQCPGPIMRLAKTVEEAQNGQIIEVKTTDPGFKLDVKSWCESTGNELIKIDQDNKTIKAYIKKGTGAPVISGASQLSNEQTIVVFSNDLDKAMASFIIANGAAAAGKKVTMFFTFWGINILRKPKSPKVKKGILDKMFGFMMPKGPDKLTLSKMNMAGMGSAMMRYVMKSKNVPSLQELIGMARMNGIKVIACNMAMDVMGLKPEELIDGIEYGGVATYVDKAGKSSSNLFI